MFFFLRKNVSSFINTKNSLLHVKTKSFKVPILYRGSSISMAEAQYALQIWEAHVYIAEAHRVGGLSALILDFSNLPRFRNTSNPVFQVLNKPNSCHQFYTQIFITRLLGRFAPIFYFNYEHVIFVYILKQRRKNFEDSKKNSRIFKN